MKEVKKIIQSKDFILCCIFSFLVFLRFLFVDSSPDPNLLKHVGEKVLLGGEIIKEPDVRDATVRYTIDLDDSDSNVLLVAERVPQFNYGDTINFSGTLKLPENFETETGIEFDYISYLSKDGIYFMMYRPEITFIENEGNPLLTFLYGVKNYFAQNVARVVPEPNSSFIGGLIFGTRNSLGETLLTDLKTVGLIHVVAISGYNVTIIATSILYLTSFFQKRNLGLFLAALFIVLFAMMVGLGSTRVVPQKISSS